MNRGHHSAVQDIDDFMPLAPEDDGHRTLFASPFASAFDLRDGGNGVLGH
jgi:hypothetical protein